MSGHCTPASERFFKYIGQKQPNGCIPWTGANTNGYGVIGRGGDKGNVRASHVAYELVYGPVPKGMYVLHICDRPNCVNPAHLFLGTQADNMADKVSKGRQAKGRQVKEKQARKRQVKGRAIGCRHGSAKLDDQKVIAIRAAVLAGESQKSVSARFEVASSTVWKIMIGKTWKHVTYCP